ncbi:antA/AntB antirepressor family protein [Corynebacterium pseudodiphtheriticum]|uniref:antA/AntB antirepressor family protein n=1 Tax=Corynebacterium pseudodiphtheriticum TaxID=37637 RepID=UPI0020BE9824|nr:antA/AntB antirepressor family protein [Corynebacterium pseudodiphtheriticum]UQV53253.1 antA/AntB antirepressor family protein [Corynebacterium pseudodiphtheriticum]
MAFGKAMTAATAELIPVHTNPDGGNVVMGRDLHEFLGVKAKYADWFPRMVDYGFSAGQDFFSFLRKNNGRGRPVEDHIISLDMAKEISMIQRTERGKQARQYFIECERRMKQLQPELTPGCFKGLHFKSDPCSKPDLTIRLKPVILVLSDPETRSTRRAGSLVVLLQRLEPSTLHPRQARVMLRTPEPFQTVPGFCLRMS